MSLRRKLLLSMVLPSLLLGMLGAIGLYSLHRLEQAAGRILADNYHSIQAARQMTLALGLLESSVIRDPTRVDWQAAQQGFEDALRQCEGNITVAGEVESLRRIRQRWERLGAELAIPRGQLVGPLLDRQLRALHGEIRQLVVHNEQAMIAYEQQTRRVAAGLRGAVAVASLAALATLALFALLFASRLARPVTEVAARLHRALAPGQPEPAVPSAMAGDELARLRQEVDALLQRLAHHEDEQARKLTHLRERLALVMNEVLEGLVLLDDRCQVLALNRVARTILGPACQEGAGLAELELREDIRAVLAPLVAGEYQAERDLGEVRYEVDGAERVYRPRVLPVAAREGGLEGYLLLFWDVTEERRFEESRRRFISMLSHQLKTPMTSLSLAVNLLQEQATATAPAQAELLSIATESCHSLATLITDLIQAARETAPDLTLKPRRLDVPRLLRAALRPLVPQAEEKELRLLLPATEPAVWATVDPVKFPWVVTNIAGNALRYTPPGGRIEVTVASRDGLLRVTVQDTGSGIPPEKLARIFQPYVSLDPEPEPGTHGLGLAIAQEIVEAHGGRLAATSEPGQGTCFLIEIPAAEGLTPDRTAARIELGGPSSPANDAKEGKLE